MGKRPTIESSSAGPGRGIVVVFSLLLAVLVLWAAPATGQQSPRPAVEKLGSIRGRVIEAESGLPLEGAEVLLERSSAGSGPSMIGVDAHDDGGLRVVTGPAGEYQFHGLLAAEYRLTVERIGYVGTDVDIDLRSGSETRLSLGLEVDPITLSPLEIRGGQPQPYARMRSVEENSESRVLADRLRVLRDLVSDTRQLTHEEVLEAITFAEPDIFRALQRVPGVSTRDDYTATMWTRGASWDQTRVYFDGLPLYNPTHAGWLFSAVNPDAIGAAAFHPGYRSARWGEGSAAVLDLQSRTGRAGELLRGNAEMSLASARLALDGELPELDLTWMLATRRSYVDVLSALAEGLGGDQDLHIPYDFADVVGRVDGRISGDWRFEASSILEYDHLRGDIPGLLKGNRGRWGNRAARLTIQGGAGPLQGRVTVGGTDFSTFIFEKRSDAPSRNATLPKLENRIAHRSVSLEIQPAVVGEDGRAWAVGAQLVRDSVTYDGPFSLLGALISGGAADTVTQVPFTYGSALDYVALWGERRWSLGSSAHLLTGARLEMGDSVYNGGTRRFGPRAALRVEPVTGTAVTLGWARTYQYTQDVSPAAGPIGPQLHLSAIWVLASPAQAYPAVKTDLATLGLERNWGAGWSLVANAYARDASGLKIPNPSPGIVNQTRDPDAEASNFAWGFELTGRREADRWSGSVGYAYGTSEMLLNPVAPIDEADTQQEVRFPSSTDIRHGVDATAIYRVSDAFRIGSAFTFGSGVPFTRLVVGDSIDDEDPPRLDAPNALRTPSYASLDVMLEYSRSIGDWQMSGFLQVRNVMNRDNAVTYAGSRECSSSPVTAAAIGPEVMCTAGVGTSDRFEPGLPRLPLIGFRVAF